MEQNIFAKQNAMVVVEIPSLEIFHNFTAEHICFIAQ